MKKTILSISFLVVYLFGVAAYAQDEDFIDDVIEPPIEEEVAEQDPLAEEGDLLDQIEKLNKISENEMSFSPYIYSERGRRNPFQRPAGFSKPVLSGETEEIQDVGGLEGYDLDAFKLTAVMWNIKHPKALVKASDNEVYVLEEGTKIGRSNGYVAKIREGEVVVVESSFRAGNKKGKKVYKTQVLKLGR